MEHKNNINYPGGYQQLADDLGNLQYDDLAEFLRLLTKKIMDDADADYRRERKKLGDELWNAAFHIGAAWKICKHFMSGTQTPR